MVDDSTALIQEDGVVCLEKFDLGHFFADGIEEKITTDRTYNLSFFLDRHCDGSDVEAGPARLVVISGSQGFLATIASDKVKVAVPRLVVINQRLELDFAVQVVSIGDKAACRVP